MGLQNSDESYRKIWTLELLGCSVSKEERDSEFAAACIAQSC
jgi:hypothetical protein